MRKITISYILKLLIKFCLAFIVTFIIFEFPFQSFLAKQKFNAYIKAQGIDKNDIQEFDIQKDLKEDYYSITGAYVIRVKYYSNPENTYYYTYHLYMHKGSRYGKEYFNILFLEVHNGYYIYNSNSKDIPSNIKYPPLRDEVHLKR